MGNNQYPPLPLPNQGGGTETSPLPPLLYKERGATHVDMLDNLCQHLSCNREGSTIIVIADSEADPQSHY